MIESIYQIRPRYDEVDQMGYVYHANHISYCHQARTELLRTYGLNDKVLEANGIMLPVISFDIKYKTPAQYDELLTITTKIKELPKIRFSFEYEIRNEKGQLVSHSHSEVVFVDLKTRKPMLAPGFVMQKLKPIFQESMISTEV